MGIEVVHDQHDLLCPGVVDIYHVPDRFREIRHRPPVRDLDVTTVHQGLEQHEEVSGTMPFVFIIVTFGLARFGRQGAAGFRH